MDTRLLYGIALVIAVISGAFYFYSGKSARLNAEKSQNLSYTASKVNILKTDPTGNLASRTSADHLEYWIENAQSELKTLNAIWYQNNQPSATFKADKAVGTDDNTQVTLLGNITAQKLPSHDQPLMTFTTTSLTSYPKEHRIETKAPIIVQTPSGRFTSQGLTANLLEGQYNFFNIRGQYAPSRGQ
jgi:LPS export ABC transporter protein LptC